MQLNSPFAALKEIWRAIELLAKLERRADLTILRYR